MGRSSYALHPSLPLSACPLCLTRLVCMRFPNVTCFSHVRWPPKGDGGVVLGLSWTGRADPRATRASRPGVREPPFILPEPAHGQYGQSSNIQPTGAAIPTLGASPRLSWRRERPGQSCGGRVVWNDLAKTPECAPATTVPPWNDVRSPRQPRTPTTMTSLATPLDRLWHTSPSQNCLSERGPKRGEREPAPLQQKANSGG